MRLETGCRLPQNLKEAVPLLADSYWNRDSLPEVPRVFGHVNSDIRWGALANAGIGAVGDCVLAEAAHGTMVWCHGAGKPFPPFTDVTIRRQYFTLTGGADSGLDPVKVAEWRVKEGLVDASGHRHTLKGYSRLRDLSDLAVAGYMYGGLGLMLSLPESAKYEFANAEPWADTSGDATGGHMVFFCGRNSAQNWMCITWGRLQAMTPEWLDRYCFGVLVYYSAEYLLPTGVSPEAIRASELEADLQRFA